MRSEITFEIDVKFGFPVTGTFIAEDGGIRHITMPDETVVTFFMRELRTVRRIGGSPMPPTAEERTLALMVRNKIADVYEDKIAATERTYDEKPYEPIRIGHRGMATV